MARRSFKKTIAQQLKELEKAKSTLPKKMGAIAVRQFKRNLHREGFIDKGFRRWPEVNRRKPGHPQFKPKQQQKMLVGKASRGFTGTIRTTKATFKETVVSSLGKRYAQYHNDGVPGKLPQRQFMGNSRTLEKNIKTIIKKEIDKRL